MGILHLKKRANRDKCTFATKQHICLGSSLSMRSFAINESPRRLAYFMPPAHPVPNIVVAHFENEHSKYVCALSLLIKDLGKGDICRYIEPSEVSYGGGKIR